MRDLLRRAAVFVETMTRGRFYDRDAAAKLAVELRAADPLTERERRAIEETLPYADRLLDEGEIARTLRGLLDRTR